MRTTQQQATTPTTTRGTVGAPGVRPRPLRAALALLAALLLVLIGACSSADDGAEPADDAVTTSEAMTEAGTDDMGTGAPQEVCDAYAEVETAIGNIGGTSVEEYRQSFADVRQKVADLRQVARTSSADEVDAFDAALQSFQDALDELGQGNAATAIPGLVAAARELGDAATTLGQNLRCS